MDNDSKALACNIPMRKVMKDVWETICTKSTLVQILLWGCKACARTSNLLITSGDEIT